jgi:hypothetical protein
MILQKISPHPITGANRAIRLKAIQYIDWDLKEANVIWEEVYLDKKDKPIFDDTITNRTIVSHLSNHNLVTQAGFMIDEINFPKTEEESDEQYKERFESLKESGHPEFDFFINRVINQEAIEQSIGLLDHLKRFDRR